MCNEFVWHSFIYFAKHTIVQLQLDCRAASHYWKSWSRSDQSSKLTVQQVMHPTTRTRHVRFLTHRTWEWNSRNSNHWFILYSMFCSESLWHRHRKDASGMTRQIDQAHCAGAKSCYFLDCLLVSKGTRLISANFRSFLDLKTKFGLWNLTFVGRGQTSTFLCGPKMLLGPKKVFCGQNICGQNIWAEVTTSEPNTQFNK